MGNFTVVVPCSIMYQGGILLSSLRVDNLTAIVNSHSVCCYDVHVAVCRAVNVLPNRIRGRVGKHLGGSFPVEVLSLSLCLLL